MQKQNIEVKVVKFVGAATNVSTAQKLGCNYARDIYYFEYRELYVTLDACYMLKVLKYERISRQGMWQRGLLRHTT